MFMTSIIKNGLVVTSDFKGFEKKDIFIENGLITNEIKDKSAVRIFDAREKFVLPGLIDIRKSKTLFQDITHTNHALKLSVYTLKVRFFLQKKQAQCVCVPMNTQ